MAEPFKTFIDDRVVTAAAGHLARAIPGFRAQRFCRDILPQLDALELKARAMCVADALEHHLPADFHAAADGIEAALAPLPANDVGGGLTGWVLWPVGEYVARRGLPYPQRALACLQHLTQRFTAEFAIRPFVAEHPTLVFETLHTWLAHPSDHVRRLVSEGTRPRLPWGMQLRALMADPSPSLALLEALQDDPSEYVRRSVANHLNDIAKDHPALLVRWLQAHLPEAPAPRRALLRHASRTLIKQGHRDALAAWGLGAAFAGTAALRVSPRTLAFGDQLTLQLDLASTSTAPQSLVIDYVVHHVKADGRTSPKVFKGWTVELPPGATRSLTRRHAVRPITTRRYYPGRHRVEIQVNGMVVADAAFELQMPARDIPHG
jgi:3-methyladenine DNA glycosylase AlkC